MPGHRSARELSDVTDRPATAPPVRFLLTHRLTVLIGRKHQCGPRRPPRRSRVATVNTSLKCKRPAARPMVGPGAGCEVLTEESLATREERVKKNPACRRVDVSIIEEGLSIFDDVVLDLLEIRQGEIDHDFLSPPAPSLIVCEFFANRLQHVLRRGPCQDTDGIRVPLRYGRVDCGSQLFTDSD